VSTTICGVAEGACDWEGASDGAIESSESSAIDCGGATSDGTSDGCSDWQLPNRSSEFDPDVSNSVSRKGIDTGGSVPPVLP